MDGDCEGGKGKGPFRCSWFGGEDGLGPGRANPSQREGWLRARESINRVSVVRSPGLDYLYSPGQTREPGEQRGPGGTQPISPPPRRARRRRLMIPGASVLLGRGGAARQRERRKESKESCGEQSGGPPRTESSRRWASPRSPRQPAGGSRHLAAGFGIFSRTLGWLHVTAGWRTWRGGIRERGAAGR